MFRAEPSGKLPSKLGKEPLVEAVFEMRFDSSAPVSSIWPGILYGSLPGDKTMENYPAFGIPKEMRDSDPNLAFVPLCKLSWGDYWIIIGDRLFAVAAKIPYVGWNQFKQAIIQAFDIVLTSHMITSVSRCSIKYIDILDGVPLTPSSCFKLQLDLGGRGPSDNDFHVRLGIKEDNITHSLQVASSASITMVSGRVLNGPVLDVDSSIEIGSESPEDFLKSVSDRSELLHESNKRLIFDCLSAEALAYLEPKYE
ncbi:hypothetical protein BV341_00358 [Pseudomonas syringae pv. actinidiae]|uniref:TIGR04255 family protein n=1 Tax=Pseudomonas syringae TaxID=317 RepID=UPI000A22995E|nr:TIGR04255 family protein [Pseudomonas syringae]OSN22939.1 hypothetical protein BV340_00355 [Pseudomonas syringae pv. actinidiae]OSN28961.1 hypothetical protein BV341_00358 [Pseudomonas syringae pv. actinidiae]OSN40782.1 hypothetical protein BV342_00357 [Pseudomonas syringae pv. actinidiae]OSN73142.1 hypothetical protein BV350_01371 [Pseudomonas syringae pv. actinidiae]OSS37171.1 hypothetical protein BV338_00359 [Pseudomonas syringae pv. actinidiae]